MAHQDPMMCYSGIVAGADLSAAGSQYKFVKWNGTDRQVVLCAATTDIPCGVLQNSPISGDAATVAFLGVTKLQGDADLTAGNSIGTSADGQAAAYTVSDTTKHIVGSVITGNSAAGGYITAAINCITHRANIA
jgi:hypothetical protein